MRTEEKRYSSSDFCQISLKKEDFFGLLERIKKPNETIEVKVGDLIFESIDEARSHPESIKFPFNVQIGPVEIELRSTFGNQVTIHPADETRVKSIVAELSAFRNPLENFSRFPYYMTLVIISMAFINIFIAASLTVAGFKPSDNHFLLIVFLSLPACVYFSIMIERRGKNRFTTSDGSLLVKYADRIIPPALSAILTAALLWVFSNWSIFLDFFATSE